MRIPRDLSGQELIKILKQLGYEITRQSGSHIRLTTVQNGQHHITIPNHNPIKPGTPNSILSDIASDFNLEKSELIQIPFN
jgi:predicted RNA binding protein YcfA (HicA-like mRNA interferase family)